METANAMHVDGQNEDDSGEASEGLAFGAAEDSDDDEDEDPGDVAMVPMADVLNARYGSENVVLYDGLSQHSLINVTGKAFL